jgi:hypothetical protein
MRSFSGPAALALRGRLVRGPAKVAVLAGAAGELLADKAPLAPPRTSPPSLAFRTLSGGVVGRELAGDGQREARLAGAAGTRQREQPHVGAAKERAHLAYLALAPDQLPGRRRQAGMGGMRRGVLYGAASGRRRRRGRREKVKRFSVPRSRRPMLAL